VNEYVAIAYEKLGLDAAGHEIGTTRFIELPDDVFYSICARRLNHVRGQLFERKEEAGWEELVRTMGFLLYKDWLRSLKSKTYEYNIHSTDHHERREAILERSANRLYKAHGYHASFTGWREYVCDASPFFAEKVLFRELPVRVGSDDYLHLYCVGGSRSGKTEYLKSLAYQVLQDPNCALVFCEPAGDASRQIARWKEHVHSDRLIYVDHSLKSGFTPCINPFEIYGVEARDTRPDALRVKKVVAQQLLGALQEIVSTGQGAEFSRNAQGILMSCILVLLDYPNATLRDLMRFMYDPELARFAETRNHYPDVRDFFVHGFHRKTLQPTKEAIQNKLQELFSTGNFADLTCGKSTIQLEKEVDQKKLIVFNLSEASIGKREGAAFGKLIVALMQSLAVRRTGKRVPTRLILDECHTYLTRSVELIITGAAKYGLFITMAQQFIGQYMDKQMEQTALGATIRIGGRNADEHHASTARMLGADPSDVASLTKGEFVIKLPESPPFLFRTHTDLLEDANAMSKREWEGVKADQLRRYYRRIEVPVPAQAVRGPSERPKPALAPPKRGNRPPSNRRPARVPITEDENIF
jgi:hypothetical protein